jgi:hypothetical protein
MLAAQNLQKTALKISELKGLRPFWDIEGFGSDESNYYVYNEWKKDAYFIINKKLTTSTECIMPEGKNERFLKIAMSGNDIVVFVSRYKKNESKGEVVKKTLYKTTGKLKNESIIASFSMKKSDFLGIKTTTSPDKSKTAFLFIFADKKDRADSYYVMVLDERHNVEWKSVYDLEVSNETFSVKDITVTNTGELYVAFFSHPENVKKAINKISYIDLVFLTEETEEKMSIPFEKYEIANVNLKPLKNGDVYLAALFTVDNQSYPSEFFSMKIGAGKLNDAGSQTKAIEEKNTHIRLPASYFLAGNFLYGLGIKKILELDNGNIAVVCEQATTVIIRSNNGSTYYKINGSVTTFFVNGNDASVEDISVMDKLQVGLSFLNANAEAHSCSIFPFAYGNKVAYLFNDNFVKYTNSAKYKGNGLRITAGKGKDACIVLSTQESGEKANIKLLSGDNAATDRLVRQILFEEEDRLIILSKTRKESYIETLSLP